MVIRGFRPAGPLLSCSPLGEAIGSSMLPTDSLIYSHSVATAPHPPRDTPRDTFEPKIVTLRLTCAETRLAKISSHYDHLATYGVIRHSESVTLLGLGAPNVRGSMGKKLNDYVIRYSWTRLARRLH